MRELQTFSFTGTKLPFNATVTIIIRGCPVAPVNAYGHGQEFLDELVTKRLITDH